MRSLSRWCNTRPAIGEIEGKANWERNMGERSPKMPLILATLVWGLAGAASAFPAMFAVMLFDAPGSERNVPTVALALSMMAFPITCLVAIIECWSSHRAHNQRRLQIWACAPLLVLAVGAAAAAWVHFMQGGKLSG
jgi:hypothetical protein